MGHCGFLNHSKFKNLGITFDSKLMFTEDINTLLGEDYRNLGLVIRKSKKFT